VKSARLFAVAEGGKDEKSRMRAVAKLLAERRSICDRQRSAYRMSSTPCSAATADSRNIDSRSFEIEKRCWEILSAYVPSSKLELVLASDATVFIPFEMSIVGDLIRRELFRRLRGAMPPGSTS
jgi:hypothetical protein